MLLDLFNYRIQSSTGDIIDHIIIVNKMIQELICIGCKHVRIEAIKYSILRGSLLDKSQQEYLDHIWTHNCPDKKYSTLIKTFASCFVAWGERKTVGNRNRINVNTSTVRPLCLSSEFLDSFLVVINVFRPKH